MPHPKRPGEFNLLVVPSRPLRLRRFNNFRGQYKSLLGARQPLVIRSKVGTSAFWYRVRLAVDSRRDAEKLCSRLRAIGGSCLVQRN